MRGLAEKPRNYSNREFSGLGAGNHGHICRVCPCTGAVGAAVTCLRHRECRHLAAFLNLRL
jgi:hypothetical protein